MLTRGLLAITPLLLLALPSCGLTPAFAGSTPTGQAALTRSIQEEAQSTALSPTVPGPASATCPAGDTALGGGWSVNPQQARVTAAFLVGSTWEVWVEASDHTLVTAYVECLSGITAVVTQRATSPLFYAAANVQNDYEPMECDPGEILVGSGFDFRATNGNVEFEGFSNTPDFGVWEAEFTNHGNSTYFLSLYLECLSAVNIPESSEVDGSSGTNLASGTTSELHAGCIPGYELAGGLMNYDYVSLQNLGWGNLYLDHAGPNGWESAVDLEPGVPYQYFSDYLISLCLHLPPLSSKS